MSEAILAYLSEKDCFNENFANKSSRLATKIKNPQVVERRVIVSQA